MAMSMKGEVLLPAERAVVWAKLNDPAVLASCIPGCESFEQTAATTFAVSARVRIGPITATFRGRIDLSRIDPPNGYRIAGEGTGGIAGFARGGADVTLTPVVGGGTLLSYDVTAEVGGRLVQLGSLWTGGVAKRTADTFFSRFAAAVQDEPGPVRERA